MRNKKNWILKLISFVLVFIFNYSCSKEVEVELPILTTDTVSDVTYTSSVGGGNITSDGRGTIIQRGICWGTTTGSENCKIGLGTGVGSFKVEINNLNANTKYYVRAYATNSKGIRYGNSVYFKTKEDTLTINDIDGNVYKTITIGTQIWMKENLKVTKYRNGDVINASSKRQWAYNNDESNGATYGRLYSWYAVDDVRGLAPFGWHVPTDDEFIALVHYIGTGVGMGYLLMASGTFWQEPKATNESGFTALPAGAYNSIFYGMGWLGTWWTSTSDGNPDNLGAYNNELDKTEHVWLHSSTSFRMDAYSIRCVKD